MPSDSSFDVVSQINRQEMVNAVDQVTREVSTRFDLKNTGSTVTLEKDAVVLACDTEFTLKAVRDILIERFQLEDGRSLSAFQGQNGRVYVPFDLEEAYSNYVTEAWAEQGLAEP